MVQRPPIKNHIRYVKTLLIQTEKKIVYLNDV